MFSKLHPRYRMLLISGLVFWLPAIGLISLVNEVLERRPLPGDVAILEYLHHTLSASWTQFFLLFTTLGSGLGIVTLTAGLASVCWYRKQRTAALIVVISVAGAAAANTIIKLLVRRDRPSLFHSVVVEHSFSFPSGHAMASSALAFSFMAICWRTRFRWWTVSLGGIFMLGVGLSRLYFGVHYPSDVVGGWAASLIWVALVAASLSSALLPTLHRKLHRQASTSN